MTENKFDVWVGVYGNRKTLIGQENTYKKAVELAMNYYDIAKSSDSTEVIILDTSTGVETLFTSDDKGIDISFLVKEE